MNATELLTILSKLYEDGKLSEKEYYAARGFLTTPQKKDEEKKEPEPEHKDKEDEEEDEDESRKKAEKLFDMKFRK